MKKFILLFLIGFAVYAEPGMGRETYIRGIDMTVDSATMKNGLTMQNGLILNRLTGGSVASSIPATNRFKGRGLEFGISKRHSGLLRSNFRLQFATLFSDSQLEGLYGTSSATIGTGSSAISLATGSFGVYEYTSNRLQTANIGFSEDIYIFHDSNHKFTEGFSIRLGGELYGNEIKSKSPYNYGISSTTFNGTTTAGFYSDGLTIDRITHNELFANAIIGLGYEVDFDEKHKVSVGFEYLKSLESMGKYENKNDRLQTIPLSTLAIPISTKVKGDVKTEMEGNRVQVGYQYSFNENLSLGIQYATSHATHRVVESKVKEAGNPLSLLAGGSSLNVLPFILSGQESFGPYPESKDIRSQISLALHYRY
ncbi:hypothetical protein P3G55_14170 [Leptospira sp. 96542]|nr:hypothetical protein [Leptospira sp. 96542]